MKREIPSGSDRLVPFVIDNTEKPERPRAGIPHLMFFHWANIGDVVRPHDDFSALFNAQSFPANADNDMFVDVLFKT